MAVTPDRKLPGIKAVGTSGLNTQDDSSTIADTALADVENMIFREGYLAPREGSSLVYEKPEGETLRPLQLITARTSDGLEYTIAVYGNHFYLRHPDVDEWVLINQSYTPTEIDLLYGYINWNNGRGDDHLYFGNGTDDTCKWSIATTTIDVDQSTGAGTLTVTDGTRFPNAAGTLLLMNGSSVFTQGYTSRSGNTLTLSGTLAHDVVAGSMVTMDVLHLPSMAKGKIFGKYNQRLIVANYHGGETVLQISVQNDPEDFSIGTDIPDGETEAIADGNGEITGLHDFGEFLVVEKEDSLHAFSYQISSDVGSKLAIIKPMISGISVGPLSMQSTAKMLNALYYPTRSNGIISLSPSGTGATVSVQVQQFSKDISTLVKRLDFSSSCSAAADNKLLWSVIPPGGAINTTVLEYDLLRGGWTKHTGLNVKSFAVKHGEVHYLDGATGKIHHLFDGSYNDNNESYVCSAHLKRFDFGEPVSTKTTNAVYIQGFMVPSSEFYIDIFFDENGVLGKQTFKINKDTSGLYFSDKITGDAGEFIMGNPVLGAASLSSLGQMRVFRGFLAVKSENQFYTVQPRIYSNKAAFYALATIGFDPALDPLIPSSMLIQPIDA